MYNFVRVGAAVPKLKIANVDYNVNEIISLVRQAEEKDVQVLTFPELCLTGYTCADLFFQNKLQDNVRAGLQKLLSETKDVDTLYIVGAPLLYNDDLYNCAIVIHKGEIQGIQPKIFMPNYNEFYEKRWFTSGKSFIDKLEYINILGYTVPFGNFIYSSEELGYKLGIEICEDLWSVIPPSSEKVLKGANIIVNPSASNDLIGKSSYRRNLLVNQSARCICGYVYTSCGVHESTTDLVFSGYAGIYENGKMLIENERFNRENSLIISEIDLDIISHDRAVNKTFSDSKEFIKENSFDPKIFIEHKKKYIINGDNLLRLYDRTPFVPNDSRGIDERCKEILSLQSSGLAKRLETSNIKKVIIGLSGGSDSTLALLVCKEAFELLNYDSKNIIAITMPGFGTSNRTYSNCIKLAKKIGISLREISIKQACIQHFKDIGHDSEIKDVTYENVQARERTQILMDIANKEDALVIGTGDLSELALGWCTYNGDHMSMYAVNVSIPKTLVKYIIKWYALNVAAKDVLLDILGTPISPELLPTDDKGNIKQETEVVLGPYEVHDFYLYYFIRFGMTPEKILMLATKAFKNSYTIEQLHDWLKVFIKRFFTQQFKRSCVPDGPKVGTVCLSPRGDWRMPSDADFSEWMM